MQKTIYTCLTKSKWLNLLDHRKFPKKDVISKVQELSRKLEFPINDFNDLARKIGVYEINIGKEKKKVSDLRTEIPKEYFPIVDKNDAEHKANRLYDRLAGSRLD